VEEIMSYGFVGLFTALWLAGTFVRGDVADDCLNGDFVKALLCFCGVIFLIAAFAMCDN
jgi:hypothetical protein